MAKKSRARGSRAPKPGAPAPRRSEARYLRDTGSGVIAARRAPLRSHKEDVRASWGRTAALAMDLIQNSGRLRGACDQVLADTVGVGLTLSPDPDLSGLGYDEAEKAEFIQLLRRRWPAYWQSGREVDFRGKFNGPKLVDIALRNYIAYGEAVGTFGFFGPQDRARYGIETGTKFLLKSPLDLVQDTESFAGLYQGVVHDDLGRPSAYRFASAGGGRQEVPAYDGLARPLVLHVFDPIGGDDVRGISSMAPAFRTYIQAETLADATLQMAILQTVFAVTLTSDSPSSEAFEALDAIKETGKEGAGFATEYVDFLASKLDAAAESRISIGGEPQVSHLAFGEKLGIETARVPGRDYQPFANGLAREMARALGVTYGGLTGDHTEATYSSVRMENASIWPVVMRRRERVAVPICQGIYEAWLDEQIGEGRIPFKGGYGAFRARRAAICRAAWHGPARPVADDLKSARAASERLQNGTSSIAHETGDLGIDNDALFEERRRDHARYVAAGMASPYAPAAVPAAMPIGGDDE